MGHWSCSRIYFESSGSNFSRLLFKSKDGPLVGLILILSCGMQQHRAVGCSLCSQNLVWWVCSCPLHSGPLGAISQWSCLALVMGNDMEAGNSVSGRGYNWQAIPLAPMWKSTHFTWECTKVNKQTLVPGRKTTFVPKLFCVQTGNLCLGTGCVGGDSSYFTCLTSTNCCKSVRDLMWVLVSEEGTTTEFREFLPWALSCRLVTLQQDFSKAYLSSATLSWNFFKSTLNLLWGFTMIEM